MFIGWGRKETGQPIVWSQFDPKPKKKKKKRSTQTKQQHLQNPMPIKTLSGQLRGRSMNCILVNVII